jgi:GrpB-like predicted nucleotidyltransferase (UPF0157 family)
LFDESSKPRSRAVLDERIMVCPADPSWPSWFLQETARLRSVLPGDLVAEIQHIGSTAVPGLDAKPIVERLGYESLGEAGVPGRWALRKRDVVQPSNIAIVAHEGEWWKLNLAVRDFLRANADAARNYALAKWHAVSNGADTLLAYSEAKRASIEMIVAEARVLSAPDPRAVPRAGPSRSSPN